MKLINVSSRTDGGQFHHENAMSTVFIFLLGALGGSSEADRALRVCVVGDGHKFCTIEMLTLVRVHRFCSNMAHFNGIDALTSDQF